MFPYALLSRLVGHVEELIKTCQSKKLWNEEEDHGPGRRGTSGSQMMLSRERSRYGEIKWRRQGESNGEVGMT